MPFVVPSFARSYLAATAGAAFVALAPAVQAQDLAGARDHPLVKRFAEDGRAKNRRVELVPQ